MSARVDPTPPASRSRRVELLLFAAGWGANHFTTMLVVYRRELALSPADLGVLFGAYALGLVPGLALAGRTSDRRGRRTVVLPASLVAILGSSALAFGGLGFDVLLATHSPDIIGERWDLTVKLEGPKGLAPADSRVA